MFRSPLIVVPRCVVLAIAMVMGPGVARAAAQAPTQPAPPDVHKLELVSDPAIKNGKIAVVEGVAGQAGQRLAVSDLSVLQPVEVTLLAADENDDLRLEVSKFILDAPAKRASTKGAGFTTARFRTQGDLQLTVVSPEGPRVYRLLVWAGTETTPPVPSLFVPISAAAAQAGTGGAATAPGLGGSMMLPVIAGVLVIIAGLLGVLVLKRGRS